MIFFTLYSRSYCHLCDDMQNALTQLMGEIPYQINVLDVDEHPQLLVKYDELVPVLFGHKLKMPQANEASIDAEVGLRLCHYFLDVERVKAFCHE